MSEVNQYEKLGLLCPRELFNLRLQLNISSDTADHFFNLANGSYSKFETGERIQNLLEDNSIRATNGLNSKGKTILPLCMQINS